jgi:uncharacterized protein YcfJ
MLPAADDQRKGGRNRNRRRAGLGAIIGSATGNAGAGAGIGAAVGLLGGALIGDQMQARQKQDEEVRRQMAAQQAEIARQQRELNQLKAQQGR